MQPCLEYTSFLSSSHLRGVTHLHIANLARVCHGAAGTSPTLAKLALYVFTQCAVRAPKQVVLLHAASDPNYERKVFIQFWEVEPTPVPRFG
eukprot:4982350-Amphidinium_carterae.3